MNKQFPLLLAAALGCAAMAAEPAKAPAPGRPAAGAAYSERQFEAAYQQLKKMLARMEQIRAAKDPQERERLLNEHRQALQDVALAMRPLDCPPAHGGACPAPLRRGGPHDRVGMMERRMDMMQMMMEQLIERESQISRAPHQEDADARR